MHPLKLIQTHTHASTPIHTVECLEDCVFPSLGGMPRLLELPVFTS